MSNNGTRSYAMNAAVGAIVVHAPVAAVYQRWLKFEDYPEFITAMKQVRKLDAHHLAAQLGFAGKRYDANLEIMLRVPERRLAWRTISNGHAPANFAAGVVSFVSRADGTTQVCLKLTSSFGGAVGRRVDKYLHNFKRLMESHDDAVARPSNEGVRLTSAEATENLTPAQSPRRSLGRE